MSKEKEKTLLQQLMEHDSRKATLRPWQMAKKQARAKNALQKASRRANRKRNG